MARKEKFAMIMEDGAEVRNIDDLKAHFDIGSVVRDFCNGQLLIWLEDRYYNEEADAIKNLSVDDDDFQEKLCAIFGVETPEEVERRKERFNRLKTFTNDEKILANVDKVAFDQEDLADLLDEDAEEIYLCANRFVIPLRMKNKNYIGMKDAIAVIRRKNPVNFDELGIKFKNIAFADDYQKIFDALQAIMKILTKITAKKTSGYYYEATTTVANKTGIHARPASVFVQKASSFKSKVQLKAKRKTVDAKSILMIMSMGLVKGTEITIVADGPDAKEAVEQLIALIDRRFDED